VTVANNGEKEVLLLIADISGYTRFIAANQTSLTHGQIVITELMRAILKELKLPLRVSKLEGDAVFFYLVKEGNTREISEFAGSFRTRIERIFAAFDHRIAVLVQSNRCPCAGCKSIEMLRLKVVVHSGRALFYRLDRFMELSGLDVILVHRLLKNNVDGDEYVLLSEAARTELFAELNGDFEQGEEHYDEVGKVNTFIFRPGRDRSAIAPGAFDTPFERWRTHQIKVWSERLMAWGILKLAAFRNLRSDVEQPSPDQPAAR